MMIWTDIKKCWKMKQNETEKKQKRNRKETKTKQKRNGKETKQKRNEKEKTQLGCNDCMNIFIVIVSIN